MAPLPSGPKAKTSIFTLPDEILTQILFLIPDPTDLVNASLINHRFNKLANDPLLYRHLCLGYQYWDERHDILRKFSARPADTNWKSLFYYRCMVEKEVKKLLGEVLDNQSGRIKRFEAISNFGYDAKDVLARHCRVGNERNDGLAMRFYSRQMIDHVHRARALEEWSRLAQGDHRVTLERGLGAFDMFVLHDEPGDLDEISRLFDDLVSNLRTEIPNIDTLTPRLKAIKALEFLRHRDYLGLNSDTRYRDLQNNYIGIALQDPEHPSLPLVSVAIYCGVARRLGLDVRPCSFPQHVHAVVYFPPNSSGVKSCMYLDPFRSNHEVPVEHLHTQLRAWGISASNFELYIGNASDKEIVLRTSRNILATINESPNGGPLTPNSNGIVSTTIRGKPYADVDNAFYSALWATFMLIRQQQNRLGDTRPDPNLVQMIMENIERHFPMDASLIEKYIFPSYPTYTAIHRELQRTLKVVRTTDSIPKQVKPRCTLERERVKWKIGQVFRHKRYGYTAVIVGWDVFCSQAAWIADNGTDDIARGGQSLYHALTPIIEDQPIRYIVEENIEIVRPENPPEEIMGIAGRYFKRWDEVNRVFVSNIKDEYPDD